MTPACIALYINLPTLNGFHWCQEIRKTSNVPVIFISSRIDNIGDEIMARQMGEMILSKNHLTCH